MHDDADGDENAADRELSFRLVAGGVLCGFVS